MMKSLMRVLCVLSLAASPAIAAFSGGPFTWGGNNLNAVAEVTLTQVTGNSSGGAFWVNLKSGSLTPSIYSGATPVHDKLFTTYCTESTIQFGYNTKYWVSIDANAFSGNVGNANGSVGDPISDVTEWIYDRWLAGNPNTWSQSDISRAIWWAEGETNGAKNSVADAALLALGYNVGSPGTLNNASHTMALNMWTIAEPTPGVYVATDVQSQLITVPAPGAVLLGMIGLGAVGWVKRRFA